MTDVIIAPRVEDPLSDTESVITGGYFQVRASRWNVTAGQWVSDAWPAPITLNGSPVTVKLDASTVPYELYVNYPDGRGGFGERTEFRTVVASGTPVKWEDLVLVDGPGSGPIYTSDLEARVAALEALPPPSGGASTLATISDMTAVARTLNAKTSTGAMLTYLNAPAIGDAPTAHTHAVPGGLVASGTASSATFLRGDGAWATPPAAGSPAWTDITGKPTTFAPALPIASSGVTGLDASVASLDTRITTASALITSQISKVMARVEQVGSLYPTPLPTGFYGISFEGQLDPADQAGITVQNTDEWVQLP